MKYIALIFLILAGCSENTEVVNSELIPNYNSTLNIHNNIFDDYINSLEYEMGEPFRKVNFVRFISEGELVDLKPTLNAICITGHGGILIKKSVWNIQDENWRYAILLHEVGHCQYGLEHTESEECDGNIMHYNTWCTYRTFIENTYETFKKEFGIE